jgi:hypothetical protein
MCPHLSCVCQRLIQQADCKKIIYGRVLSTGRCGGACKLPLFATASRARLSRACSASASCILVTQAMNAPAVAATPAVKHHSAPVSDCRIALCIFQQTNAKLFVGTFPFQGSSRRDLQYSFTTCALACCALPMSCSTRRCRNFSAWLASSCLMYIPQAATTAVTNAAVPHSAAVRPLRRLLDICRAK